MNTSASPRNASTYSNRSRTMHHSPPDHSERQPPIHPDDRSKGAQRPLICSPPDDRSVERTHPIIQSPPTDRSAGTHPRDHLVAAKRPFRGTHPPRARDRTVRDASKGTRRSPLSWSAHRQRPFAGHGSG